MCFTLAIFAVAALVAWCFHKSAGNSLVAVSYQGHYEFHNPYEIIGEDMAGKLAFLFLGSAAACLLLFLVLVRRIRSGVERLVRAFLRSAEGDLSSPTSARGPRDIVSLCTRLDAYRSQTLSQIDAIRTEAADLKNAQPPPDEFARRWDALKRSIRTVAP